MYVHFPYNLVATLGYLSRMSWSETWLLSRSQLPQPFDHPRLLFKDALQRDLAAFKIPVATLETVALERSSWCSVIHSGCSVCSQGYINDCDRRWTPCRLRRVGQDDKASIVLLLKKLDTIGNCHQSSHLVYLNIMHKITKSEKIWTKLVIGFAR